MTQRISEQRKTAFYVGTGLMVIGGLLFASTFITFISNFGGSPSAASTAGAGMLRAFIGIGLAGVGTLVRGIGARGLAGSGVVLDPKQARQDLEPYSRMAGGMLGDALDEADVNLSGESEQVVMLRCTACRTLNEESSKFCQECGAAV